MTRSPSDALPAVAALLVALCTGVPGGGCALFERAGFPCSPDGRCPGTLSCVDGLCLDHAPAAEGEGEGAEGEGAEGEGAEGEGEGAEGEGEGAEGEGEGEGAEGEGEGEGPPAVVVGLQGDCAVDVAFDGGPQQRSAAPFDGDFLNEPYPAGATSAVVTAVPGTGARFTAWSGVGVCTGSSVPTCTLGAAGGTAGTTGTSTAPATVAFVLHGPGVTAATGLGASAAGFVVGGVFNQVLAFPGGNVSGPAPAAFFAAGQSGALLGQPVPLSATAPGTLTVSAVAVDDAGDVFAGGNFTGTLHLPGCPDIGNSDGDSDLWVARFQAPGQCTWLTDLGGTPPNPGAGAPSALAIAGSEVVAVGTSTGSFVGPSGPVPGFTGTGMFVAGFDAGAGALVALNIEGGNGGATLGNGVAFDAAHDRLLVVGDATGTVHFAGNSFTKTFTGAKAGFLAHYLLSAGTFGLDLTTSGLVPFEGTDAANDSAGTTGVAVDDAGDAVVVGVFRGALHLGAASETAAALDSYIAVVGDTPAAVTGAVLTGTGTDRIEAVAPARFGAVVVAGESDSAAGAQLGSDPPWAFVSGAAPAGANVAFVAKVDTASLRTRFAHSFASFGGSGVFRVAVAPAQGGDQDQVVAPVQFTGELFVDDNDAAIQSDDADQPDIAVVTVGP